MFLCAVTDSMLDGYIAGFPNTYATKVGKTSDEMYKASVLALAGAPCVFRALVHVSLFFVCRRASALTWCLAVVHDIVGGRALVILLVHVQSMMCSSLFPRCTTPQSRDEPIPVGGRVPVCTHLR